MCVYSIYMLYFYYHLIKSGLHRAMSLYMFIHLIAKAEILNWYHHFNPPFH